jgi:prephenate dehydrogenase
VSRRDIQSLALVGAAGRMGRLLSRAAREAGVAVRGVERDMDEAGVARALRGADLVLLAVPIEGLDKVLSGVAPHLSEDQILADVCSVKVVPVRHMKKVHSGPVVGAHPLFGPDPSDTDPLKVAVTEAGDSQAAGAVAAFFQRLGMRPFATSAEDHDQAMALIQGLNFVTTVAYLSCTAKTPGIEEFLTPSFQRRLDAARKMLTTDAEMFEAMFETNPSSQEVVRKFHSFLSLAAGGDVSLLCDRATWWWRDDVDAGGA